MSEQIDWSKAPADAEYWCEMQFFKTVNGEWMVWCPGLGSWIDPAYKAPDNFSWWGNAVARPTTPSWSGGGLPPVGVKVLIMNPEQFAITDYGQEFVGEECTVRAVFVNDLDYRMVAVEKVGGACCCFISEMCFPIRTPEQIAEDEREVGIAEMKRVFDSVSDNLMPTSNAYLETIFGALHDKGYRKP